MHSMVEHRNLQSNIERTIIIQWWSSDNLWSRLVLKTTAKKQKWLDLMSSAQYLVDERKSFAQKKLFWVNYIVMGLCEDFFLSHSALHTSCAIKEIFKPLPNFFSLALADRFQIFKLLRLFFFKNYLNLQSHFMMITILWLTLCSLLCFDDNCLELCRANYDCDMVNFSVKFQVLSFFSISFTLNKSRWKLFWVFYEWV